ncbi:uncharacterized protein FIBRA_04248 [Fibroporia radiculosa]|uniref:Protein-S-isoprenylcysteine O-methyltransferase n=1 Tax=Fibroporia radiculosa TaxID=599839 RepID=J4GP02_9APHY|nr:uncharacterized protein FIBRA_04248 [Fibroporia radiculosa]CCM02170.1 predicted protein [Fibroporia radiculosa]
MSLVKLPFLLLNVRSVYATLTPPTPQVPANERAKTTISERVFSTVCRACTLVLKSLLCTGSILEVVVILAAQWPSLQLSEVILSLLVNGPRSLVGRIALSRAFLVGCGLVNIGAFIRIRCYRALGRHFTYEIAIKDDHQLVTSGPYSYVRHPSYTSGLICWAGMVLACVGHGS